MWRARTVLVLLHCGLCAFGALAQDFHVAPHDSTLADTAQRFVWSKRIGAIALWGGLLVASLIIGWVRARARRRT